MNNLCQVIKERDTSIEVMKLTLFTFTLNDKTKYWSNNLKPSSFDVWVELHAQFLKKFCQPLPLPKQTEGAQHRIGTPLTDFLTLVGPFQ